jgi:hypothetical protein
MIQSLNPAEDLIMSKKPPQPAAPISGQDLRRYLETDDDFALELEAYRHALGFGFKASHAGLYDDAMTNKRRQYDVRASYELENRTIYLTIECKSLHPTNPLLVQRVPRPGNESFHEIMQSKDSIPPSMGTASVLPPGWMGGGLFKLSGTHLYDSQKQVGKSLKRVKVAENGFSASDSDIDEKYTQALSSMNEFVQSAAIEMRLRRTQVLSRVFLPILLVSDAALWVADYSASVQLIGDPRPEAEETTFYLGWDYELHNPPNPIQPATFTISHLHIMTRRRLPEFLREIQQRGPIWDQLFGG